ncbi:right-handed parallel beta-helix repeat-containing protein [Microbacteriaceae bacterium 4G12]
MGTFARSKSSPFLATAGALGVLASLLAMPAAAHAATDPVTVNGSALAGSTQAGGSFTVAVAAPAGVAVKFKLDGAYLGQDRTAPYTWTVKTTAGKHELIARWESAERHDYERVFSVRAAGSPAPAPAPRPTTAPAPAPTAAPQPAPSTAPVPSGRTVSVSTATQLKAALKAATPGTTIALADGTYTGAFVAAASGTAAAPITLTGSRRAVLTTGTLSSGYGLHVTGDRWRIVGLSVTRSGKGIVLDGANHAFISGVDVGNTGTEAVHFRTNSSYGILRDSVVHDVGLSTPDYGEGVYVGSANSNWSKIMGSSSVPDRSDRVQILNNRIVNTTAEGIDIKEGTTGGTIAGNVFENAGFSGIHFADSWVDVKGNGWRIEGNSGSRTKLDAFQVHRTIPGWGNGNSFSRNTVVSGVPGYEVSVASGTTGNTVACGPTGAALGKSNIACR